MYHVPIDRDFDAFRRAVRRLLTLDVPPGDVDFDPQSIFGGETLPTQLRETEASLPPKFAQMVKQVAHHRDPQRWTLLYALIRRVHHGERHLLDLASDPEVRRLVEMEKAIRRDVHKTHAFVRFREAEDGRFVAWHRPDHYTLRLSVPHFRDRFRGMAWAILTPDESAVWDGHQLCFGPGAERAEAPAADELEQLWQTYYRHIFNPARVKLKAMRAEMPVRFWDLLPETAAIPQMLAEAPERVKTMVAATQQPKVSAADFLPADRSLPSLRAASKGCRGCDLYCNATQTVFGEGPSDAKVVFIGEQPGDNEDLQGRPFVGPAGQLMDELLQEAGVDRKQVYVTNTVKHFKFVQRGRIRLHQKPGAREVNSCLPWLDAEMEAIKPPMVVALGATAAQAIMGKQFRITQSRGEVMPCKYGDWFMAAIHPSAILRIPDDAGRSRARSDFVSDMRKVAQKMQQLAA